MMELGFWPDVGYVFCGEASGAYDLLKDMHCLPALIVADPPYGNILSVEWDKNPAEVEGWISTMVSLSNFDPCPTVYWWGGIGKPGSRPFFQFILDVERTTSWRMRDCITWSKKRAYGKPGDYLFTREECAVFTHLGGKYATFNIPLLDEKRGYAGYNAKYPAKSEYKRRTNVWHETEILKGKLHPAHKAPAVCRIPIEVHTRKGDLVLDLYAGSGETSVQALALGRPFIGIEKDRKTANAICSRISDLLDEKDK